MPISKDDSNIFENRYGDIVGKFAPDTGHLWFDKKRHGVDSDEIPLFLKWLTECYRIYQEEIEIT